MTPLARGPPRQLSLTLFLEPYALGRLQRPSTPWCGGAFHRGRKGVSQDELGRGQFLLANDQRDRRDGAAQGQQGDASPFQGRNQGVGDAVAIAEVGVEKDPRHRGEAKRPDTRQMVSQNPPDFAFAGLGAGCRMPG